MLQACGLVTVIQITAGVGSTELRIMLLCVQPPDDMACVMQIYEKELLLLFNPASLPAISPTWTCIKQGGGIFT